MALKINADVATSDGFTVQPFAFLEIQLYKSLSRALITYYKDQAAYKAGSSPVNVTLPTLAEVDLNKGDFFGPDLAKLFHDKAIELIEQVTGPGTVQIIE
jgi:hypothetical protein